MNLLTSKYSNKDGKLNESEISSIKRRIEALYKKVYLSTNQAFISKMAKIPNAPLPPNVNRIDRSRSNNQGPKKDPLGNQLPDNDLNEVDISDFNSIGRLRARNYLRKSSSVSRIPKALSGLSSQSPMRKEAEGKKRALIQDSLNQRKNKQAEQLKRPQSSHIAFGKAYREGGTELTPKKPIKQKEPIFQIAKKQTGDNAQVPKRNLSAANFKKPEKPILETVKESNIIQDETSNSRKSITKSSKLQSQPQSRPSSQKTPSESLKKPQNQPRQKSPPKRPLSKPSALTGATFHSISNKIKPAESPASQEPKKSPNKIKPNPSSSSAKRFLQIMERCVDEPCIEEIKEGIQKSSDIQDVAAKDLQKTQTDCAVSPTLQEARIDKVSRNRSQSQKESSSSNGEATVSNLVVSPLKESSQAEFFKKVNSNPDSSPTSLDKTKSDIAIDPAHQVSEQQVVKPSLNELSKLSKARISSKINASPLKSPVSSSPKTLSQKPKNRFALPEPSPILPTPPNSQPPVSHPLNSLPPLANKEEDIPLLHSSLPLQKTSQLPSSVSILPSEPLFPLFNRSKEISKKDKNWGNVDQQDADTPGYDRMMMQGEISKKRAKEEAQNGQVQGRGESDDKGDKGDKEVYQSDESSQNSGDAEAKQEEEEDRGLVFTKKVYTASRFGPKQPAKTSKTSVESKTSTESKDSQESPKPEDPENEAKKDGQPDLEDSLEMEERKNDQQKTLVESEVINESKKEPEQDLRPDCTETIPSEINLSLGPSQNLESLNEKKFDLPDSKASQVQNLSENFSFRTPENTNETPQTSQGQDQQEVNEQFFESQSEASPQKDIKTSESQENPFNIESVSSGDQSAPHFGLKNDSPGKSLNLIQSEVIEEAKENEEFEEIIKPVQEKDKNPEETVGSPEIAQIPQKSTLAKNINHSAEELIKIGSFSVIEMGSQNLPQAVDVNVDVDKTEKPKENSLDGATTVVEESSDSEESESFNNEKKENNWNFSQQTNPINEVQKKLTHVSRPQGFLPRPPLPKKTEEKGFSQTQSMMANLGEDPQKLGRTKNAHISKGFRVTSRGADLSRNFSLNQSGVAKSNRLRRNISNSSFCSDNKSVEPGLYERPVRLAPASSLSEIGEYDFEAFDTKNKAVREYRVKKNKLLSKEKIEEELHYLRLGKVLKFPQNASLEDKKRQYKEFLSSGRSSKSKSDPLLKSAFKLLHSGDADSALNLASDSGDFFLMTAILSKVKGKVKSLSPATVKKAIKLIYDDYKNKRHIKILMAFIQKK